MGLNDNGGDLRGVTSASPFVLEMDSGEGVWLVEDDACDEERWLFGGCVSTGESTRGAWMVPCDPFRSGAIRGFGLGDWVGSNDRDGVS